MPHGLTAWHRNIINDNTNQKTDNKKMATDNNRTKTPNDAVKITELPEGSQLLLVDKSGTVLERMEAERFMELLRATVQVGGRNLLRNTNKGSTNWQVNTEYPKVCEGYVWPDGTRGAHLKILDTSASVAGTYKILMYKMETAVLKWRLLQNFGSPRGYALELLNTL